MKKSLICTALIILGVAIVLLFTYKKEERALPIPISKEEVVKPLPTVETLIAPNELELELLENNRFIAILGLQHAGDDYYDVAKHAFIQNYENVYQQRLKVIESLKYKAINQTKFLPYAQTEGLLKLIDDESLLTSNKFCLQYLDSDCVQKIIKQKDNIQKLRKDNEKLIARYYDIFDKYPQETLIVLPSVFMNSQFQNYSLLPSIMELELAHIILLFNNGQFDEGIESLLTQQKIIKQMINGDQTTTFDGMSMTLDMSLYFDLYINALLSSEYAQILLENPQFNKLMANSYSDQDIYKLTANSIVYDASITDLETVYWAATMDSVSNEEILSFYTARQKIYEKFVQDYQINEATEQASQLCENLLNILLATRCDVYFYFIDRATVQLNLHKMVYLKYLILKNHVKAQDIPEFLISQGNLAVNTITKTSFLWDAEKHAISSLVLLDSRAIPMPIIKILNRKNKTRSLLITIPQRDSK